MLNAKKLGEIISSLANDLEYYAESHYINSIKMEGADHRTISERKEYCLGGDVGSCTEHEICLHLLAQVVHDMPKTAANLIWSWEPEYETQEDFKTGKKMHRVGLRLGWREL